MNPVNGCAGYVSGQRTIPELQPLVRRGLPRAAARAHSLEVSGSSRTKPEAHQRVREAVVGQQVDRPRRRRARSSEPPSARRSSPDTCRSPPPPRPDRAASAGSWPDPSTAPPSSSRPKFGSRPSATRGQMYSSDAPSSSSIVTRGPLPQRRPRRRDAVATGRVREPATAAAARGERQRQRRDHRDDEQRRADPAAAPAERVVRDRNAEQHDRGRRRRRRRRRSSATPPSRRAPAAKPRTFSHISDRRAGRQRRAAARRAAAR